MKSVRKQFLICTALAFASCTVMGEYSQRGYTIGELYTVSVGSTMVFWEKNRATYKIEGGKKKLIADSKTTVFRWELLYAGLNHHVLQILYREFQNTGNGITVRPAFSQIYQYDLNDGATDIAFRSIRLKVFEANSQIIKFTVVEETIKDEN